MVVSKRARRPIKDWAATKQSRPPVSISCIFIARAFCTHEAIAGRTGKIERNRQVEISAYYVRVGAGIAAQLFVELKRGLAGKFFKGADKMRLVGIPAIIRNIGELTEPAAFQLPQRSLELCSARKQPWRHADMLFEPSFKSALG